MTDYVSVSMEGIGHHRAHKLLSGSVVPRPIAWISTLSERGTVNIAPFSCYTYVSTEPAMIAVNIGSNRASSTGPKDTQVNVNRTGEFVVNIVREADAEVMHESSAEYPADMSEAETLKIPLCPSVTIAPPGVRDSPVRMECVVDQILTIGGRAGNQLVIANVRMMHIRQDLYDNDRINSFEMRPLGRIGGPNYTTQGTLITARKPQTPWVK